jgi:hypothetical protein
LSIEAECNTIYNQDLQKDSFREKAIKPCFILKAESVTWDNSLKDEKHRRATRREKPSKKLQ